MEMIRTFHPVGQGAFYSEEFSQESNIVFRVVYDCGCIRRKVDESHGRLVVEKWIEGMGDNKIINYLFISHFDYDHVSLLNIFKERRVYIEKVVLPLLSDDEKFLCGLYDGLYGEGQQSICGKIVSDANSYFGSDTKIIRVLPSDDDAKNERDAVYDGKSETVDSGTMFPVRIARGQFNWFYVPFNYDDKNHRKTLIELLADSDVGFGPQFDPRHLENFSELIQQYERGRGLPKLKKIYEKIGGGINLNSMVVLSVPNASECRMESFRISGADFEIDARDALNAAIQGEESRPSLPGCLYTGDIDMTKAPIAGWSAPYLDKIGTIQVAHHGSYHSFSEKVFKRGGCFCPISCSKQRYYGHPHGSVVSKLALWGNFPVCVTNDICFTEIIC